MVNWGEVLKLSINGTEVSDAWYDALLDARIELEFRVPARATLRFLDEGYGLSTDGPAKLGAAVVVEAVPRKGAARTLLKGEITGLGVEQDSRAEPELVITIHDRAYRLTRGTRIETYLKSTYSDVVRQIASRHGLSADISPTSLQLEYVMQAETDFAVMDLIAARTGFDWWVDDTTLHCKAPQDNPEVRQQPRNVTLGTDLETFSARASGLFADTVHVEGWDRKSQNRVSASAAAGEAALKPDSEMFKAFLTPGSKLNGTQDLLATGLAPQSADEAQQIAKALRDQALACAIVATGTLLDGSDLRPGRKLHVHDAGPTGGLYYVTRVEHRYRDRFETRFVAGDRRPTSLVDTLARTSSAPPPWQHLGMVVGTVTNLNDPDKSGRVKVKFPGVTPDKESAWARVLTAGAGNKRGFVVMPEVGDEVLVGFESGDLRQPVVLGGLFGEKSPIPLWDVDNGQVAGRRITSRLGHVFELKDGKSPKDQHLLLMLAGEEHKLRLGKDAVAWDVPSGVPFTLKVGDNASIAIDASGALTIKAVNITLEAQGKLEAKAQAEIKFESSGALEVKSQMTAVKGTMLQLESSGPATIKGNPVAIN